MKLQRRILAREMKCYRKILDIAVAEYGTNEAVQRNIHRISESYEDFFTSIKIIDVKTPCKNHFAWNSCRNSQYQRKRSENKIEELTSMEEAESLRVAKDREKWRRVVKMSSNRGQVRSRDKQI